MSATVILVGVGGASCSGKTTLAKHLLSILPNSFIIHQDDFAPPEELIPVHPIYNVQDWDAPAGAIDWPRLIRCLKTLKATGQFPDDHKSHDHLNNQRSIPVPNEMAQRWRSKFSAIEEAANAKGKSIKWGLVDGFLLYWHQEVIDLLDARLFLRVPHDVLRQRRHERNGYHTAVQSDPEGSFWQDPPQYWEQIVYPAYVEAHRDVFTAGNVEEGEPTEKVSGLTVLSPLNKTMGEVVEESCMEISSSCTA